MSDMTSNNFGSFSTNASAAGPSPPQHVSKPMLCSRSCVASATLESSSTSKIRPEPKADGGCTAISPAIAGPASARQKQRDRAPLARDTSKYRAAPALTGKAIDLGKAEPRSASRGPGREIGLKGPRHRLGRHARTGVHQRDGDKLTNEAAASGLAAAASIARHKSEGAAIRHGVAGVDGNIEQGQFKLRRIDRHWPQKA